MLNQSLDSFDRNLASASAGQALDGFSLYYAPVIDSTMNLQAWCQERGIPVEPGLCLVAGRQTHGVGQHGSWVSSSQDVKLSIVLPEVATAAQHAIINCVAAFAVQRTLTELARDFSIEIGSLPKFGVKLVNDVLVPFQGTFHKISGSLGVGKHDPAMRALLQNRDNFVFPDNCIVMGIGINLQTLERPVVDPRFPPVALEQLIGTLIRREVAVGVLLRNFQNLSSLAASRPGMLLHALQSELATSGGEVLVVSKSGAESTGFVSELSPTAVRYKTSGETREIALEDVQRIIPKPA